MSGDFIIFAGTASPELARAVAGQLQVPLGAAAVERYPDGELSVRIEESVRGRDVFIIQSTQPPVNENLMELLAFADACRRASAASTTAVVPYFGYARSDTRHGRREPIAASMVADLLQTVGISHLITVDVHAPQIEGFFRIPFDNLTALGIFADALREHLQAGAVVVSPDVGRVKVATEFAQRFQTPVVVLHKRRESGTKTAVTCLVGDVRGRSCLIVDDMISTGGTIIESVQALLAAGAAPDIVVAATHGLLVGNAREKLDHESIREVLVTDTVSSAASGWKKLRVISAAPLIADAIRRSSPAGRRSQRAGK